MEGGQRVRSDKGPLQIITELAGLLATAAAVIYGTGAVVLALRLSFEHLPWSDVVSGLPREFVVSTGAGQVLLPSLAVGALYGLYRALRETRTRTPDIRRLRESSGARWVVLLRYLLTMGAMLLPLLFVKAVRGINVEKGLDLWLGMGLGILLVLVAIAVQEGRAVAVKHIVARREWNSVKAAATMASLYALAAMPAMMLAAAATPLTSVKVCTREGGEESARLVGETNDRVYLREEAVASKGKEGRRIVVIPMTEVKQLFVGPQPAGAICGAQ